MPRPQPPEFKLADEDAASRFGAALGGCLRPGMTVLLQGPVGAGKSHIARAAIRALAGQQTDVPSPSFTLVQTYPGPVCQIWHADLYRLSGPDEVAELGLEDAIGQEIVLVEWPDRLGAFKPDDAVTLDIRIDGNSRQLSLAGASPDLLACVMRKTTP